MNPCYVTSILPPVLCCTSPLGYIDVSTSLAHGMSFSNTRPSIFIATKPLVRPKLKGIVNGKEAK